MALIYMRCKHVKMLGLKDREKLKNGSTYNFGSQGFQGSISPTYLRPSFTPVAPKSVRIQPSVSIFLRFQDLRVQKLLVERC